MRKLMITLMLLAIPLMGGAALAASDSGTVNRVDTRTGMLILSDGARYYVPNRVELSRLKAGDDVRIQFERQEGMRVADDIVKTGSSEAAGSVATPTRADAGVQKNFMNEKSDMCKPTETSKNPCYDIGGQ